MNVMFVMVNDFRIEVPWSGIKEHTMEMFVRKNFAERTA